MNNPKFREKVLIGLENAPPSFNVRGKVMGPNGANLLYITNETGAIVTIRGRGSGFLEPNTGTESIEPLHICIEHSKYEVLQAGRQLAFNLIDTVQQEWANLQHQIQQEQPQQQQPPPPPPPPQQHQQPPSVVSSSSNGPPPSLVTNEGVEVVTSVAPPPTPVSMPPSSAGMPPSSAAIMPPSSVALPAGFTQQAVSQMITVPPPSHVAIPPPTLHMPPQMATSQVTQVATSTSNGTLVHSSETSQTLVTAGTSTPGQEIAAPQTPAQPPTINIPHQQQLFLSNQGAILQPQTLIPQQQQIITPTGQVISAQPQMLAQSYLLQTNSGQMVVSYPNIVRPAGTVADQMRGQQLMLVQYGEGGAVKTSAVRAPVPAAHQAVPQMVQIVNPQTGQIQHVLQHIQPQIQMQQAQLQPQLLQQGTNILGQQVLMPFQAPIQFTSQPQQMIITQPPPQMQQQQIMPSNQALQHVIPTSQPLSINVSQRQIVLNIAKQQQQGLKRKFDGDQQQQPLSIMDAQTLTQLQQKKGLGNLWLVSSGDGTSSVCSTAAAYRYPTTLNLGVPSAASSEALLIHCGPGDLTLHDSQVTKVETMTRQASQGPQQQELLVQSGDKNQYGQDDWRRSSPLVAENCDGRGDISGMDGNKRQRVTQNGQANGVTSGDNRADSGVERYQQIKVEGQQLQPAQLQQGQPQIYNVAIHQQQQGLVQRQQQQQSLQQIFQTGTISAQPGQPQTQTHSGQVAVTSTASQMTQGAQFAQQMYAQPPPPQLPSSSGQVGSQPQQFVGSPLYMPPQQQYAAAAGATYNPWIMPS